MDIAKTAHGALDEIGAVLSRISTGDAAAAVAEIRQSDRIALYGVGREGLMMKALAMRLFHLGLDAHIVGDMTTPPVGPGDLLMVSAGPGSFSTVSALVGVAAKSGARTLCFTAEPDGAVPQMCDVVLTLPAQTMASDQQAATSILPMGSLYEGAQFVFFEILILMLRDTLNIAAEEMRGNHTNLE